MPRVKRGATKHKRKKRILKAAKGYWGGRHRLYRTAKEAVRRANQYAFFGRKQKKRAYRSLWIQRLNAAVRARGMTYGEFVNGLKRANVSLDRKTLSELAIHDEGTFEELIALAREH